MAYKNELEKLEQRYRENPSQWFAALADSYRKAGELELALEVVRSGIVDRPDYASAHIVLGRVLVDMERDLDASHAFRRVLELDAENIIALRTLSEIAERQGEVVAAREWIRRLLEVDPLNEDAHEALIRLDGLAPVEEDEAESVGEIDLIQPDSDDEFGFLAATQQMVPIQLPDEVEEAGAEREDPEPAAAPEFLLPEADVEDEVVTEPVAAADQERPEVPHDLPVTPDLPVDDDVAAPLAEADESPLDDLVIEPESGSELVIESHTEAEEPLIGDPTDIAPDGLLVEHETEAMLPTHGARPPGIDDLNLQDGEAFGVGEPDEEETAPPVERQAEPLGQEFSEVEPPTEADVLGVAGFGEQETPPVEPEAELVADDDWLAASGADAADAAGAADAADAADATVLPTEVEEAWPEPGFREPLEDALPELAAADEPVDVEAGDAALAGVGSDVDSADLLPRELPPEDAVTGGAAEPVRTEPEPVVTSTMAEVYAQQGLVREAREICERLLEQRPGDPDLLRKLQELDGSVERADVSSPPSRFSVAHTGGESARTALKRIFSVAGNLARSDRAAADEEAVRAAPGGEAAPEPPGDHEAERRRWLDR